MKNTFLLFICSYTVLAASAQAPSRKTGNAIIEGEKRAGKMRMSFYENPRSADYNIIYDECFWKIDPAVRFISGHINTYFIPKSNLTSITLDLSDSLVADSIIYQNAHATFSHTNNLLAITFTSSLNVGTTYNADIYYHGTPQKDTSGFGSFGQIKHGPDSTYAIWTLSEPYGASQWWPCKNSLTDKIDSADIYVTTPSQYKDASNGVLVSENISNGFTTYHWKTRYPIATYLVSINAAVFSVYNDTSIFKGDTLLIQNFIWKEDSANVRHKTPDLLPGLHLYDSLFGIYPFYKEKYGHAEMGWGGGMEHQTMTYAGNFSFELLVHECAHQWFGDKVTCARWEDIFLNEGFAVYLTDLCYEFLFSGQWWPVWKTNCINTITSQPGGSLWVNDTTNVNRIFDERLTYNKGGYFLHMLRYQVGDAGFFAGVRNYLNDPSLSFNFSHASDLKKHIEAASGKNLTTYFNQWYYSEGFPSYQLSWAQNSSNLINLTVNQTTSVPSSVSFFKLDIPVKFKNANRDTVVRLTDSINGQTFTIQLPFHADSVLFDPDRWLISANNIVTGLPFVPVLSYDINIFPNPASSTFSISTNDNLPHIQSVKLVNTLGEIIFENTLAHKTNTLSLNCSNIRHGTYFLKIKTETGELNRKIVVMNK